MTLLLQGQHQFLFMLVKTSNNKSIVPVSVFDKQSNQSQNGTIILTKTDGIWYLTDLLAEGQSNSATEEELRKSELEPSIPVVSP